MSIWQMFKRWQTGLQQKKKKKRYSSILSDLFHRELTQAKTSEKRSHKKRIESLSDNANSDELYQGWIKLSPREQDVTALTCLKYTNPQIAARLGLSRGTVRSYLEKVLNKLGLQNKADLRVYFAVWDFSEFERRSDPHR
jgi:DNA-binding CsgD family transcriptional regulator